MDPQATVHINRLIDLGFSREQIAEMLGVNPAEIDAALEPLGFLALIAPTIEQRLAQYICASQRTLAGLPEHLQDCVAVKIAELLKFEGELAEAERRRWRERPSSAKHLNPALLRRWDEFKLTPRNQRALQRLDHQFLWQTAVQPDSQLLKTKDFGRKSLQELLEILHSLGIDTGTTLSEGLQKKLRGW